MEKSFLDLVRLLLPLGAEKRRHLSVLSEYLQRDELSYVKYLLKLRRIGVSYESLGVSKQLVREQGFPQLHAAVDDVDIRTFLKPLNDRLRRGAEVRAFKEFSSKAARVIPSLIAPHIIGFDDVKLAVAWQLFCPERVHILLLGDPATGKTEILHAASQLAPISSFGLGSGTSGVGLAASFKGGKVVKGLLPLAHKGLCCIDELNLMKPRDRGALLNAMEKGFVTYDKGGSHLRIPAEVRVLATANPKGDRFIGSSVKFLREQLPFDPALLSRFHLVFLIRKPTTEEFLTITRSLITKKDLSLRPEDVSFVKDYVAFAEKVKVEFDKDLEPVITDAVEDLKAREDEFLVEFSPRIVVGIVRLSNAVARMSLREKVTHDDVAAVLTVLKKSLVITPDTRRKAGARQKK